MTNTKKLIRFTLINTGGEYTGGIIDNDFIKEKIREKISEGSVNSSMDFGDDYFDAVNHTNILHTYGPKVPHAEIRLEESYDVDVEDDNNRDYNEIFSGNIYEYGTDINTFESSNPSPFDFPSDFTDDDLIFYSQKTEKRIHYPVVIEIADGEEFNIGNLYIGYQLMDETIGSDDEIIEDLLYIPTEKAKEYIREFNPEEYDRILEKNEEGLTSQDVRDIFSQDIKEIYPELPELKDKIRNNHLIYPDYIEGKGEWENDYVRVTSLDGEVLFEGGQY